MSLKIPPRLYYIEGDEMQGIKKALIVGILLAIAIGLAYPLAVSALSSTGRASGLLSSSSNGLVTTSTTWYEKLEKPWKKDYYYYYYDDYDDYYKGYYYYYDDYDDYYKRFRYYHDDWYYHDDYYKDYFRYYHDDYDDYYKRFGKTVLSALINIISTNMPNTSIGVGDKAWVVLLKKGGNYSLLLIVKAKSSRYVYQVMADVTSLTIGSDSILISGLVKRSTLPDFTNGSQVFIEVMIGSASIASESYQLSGDILGLRFFR